MVVIKVWDNDELSADSFTASGSHLDLSRAPYDVYGVKYIDLVSLAPFSGHGASDLRRGQHAEVRGQNGTLPLVAIPLVRHCMQKPQ